MLKPSMSENCTGLTMKCEVKYLYLSLSSDTNFCIYQLPKGLGMREL